MFSCCFPRERRGGAHEDSLDEWSEVDAVRLCRRGDPRSAGLTGIELTGERRRRRLTTWVGGTACRARCDTVRQCLTFIAFFLLLSPKEYRCTPNCYEPSARPDMRTFSLRADPGVSRVVASVGGHRISPVLAGGWARCSFGQAPASSVTDKPHWSWLTNRSMRAETGRLPHHPIRRVVDGSDRRTIGHRAAVSVP